MITQYLAHLSANNVNIHTDTNFPGLYLLVGSSPVDDCNGHIIDSNGQYVCNPSTTEYDIKLYHHKWRWHIGTRTTFDAPQEIKQHVYKAIGVSNDAEFQTAISRSRLHPCMTYLFKQTLTGVELVYDCWSASNTPSGNPGLFQKYFDK